MAMADEALGEIQLTLCKKYHKAKGAAFDKMASVFKSSPIIVLYHGTTIESAQKLCTIGPDAKFFTGSTTGNGAGEQRVGKPHTG
jgi:hypothetical protein